MPGTSPAPAQRPETGCNRAPRFPAERPLAGAARPGGKASGRRPSPCGTGHMSFGATPKAQAAFDCALGTYARYGCWDSLTAGRSRHIVIPDIRPSSAGFTGPIVQGSFQVAPSLAEDLKETGSGRTGPAANVAEAFGILLQKWMDAVGPDGDPGGDRSFPVATRLLLHEIPSACAKSCPVVEARRSSPHGQSP